MAGSSIVFPRLTEDLEKGYRAVVDEGPDRDPERFSRIAEGDGVESL